MRRIYVSFNQSKQRMCFIVHNVRLETFIKEHDCQAWFIERAHRKQRRGLFGYIHMPAISKYSPEFSEFLVHEIQHGMHGWILARNVGDLRGYMERQEERIATMAGEIVRKFWRQYQKG